jgi:tetratricopeptide (TPR) repeat protein
MRRRRREFIVGLQVVWPKRSAPGLGRGGIRGDSACGLLAWRGQVCEHRPSLRSALRFGRAGGAAATVVALSADRFDRGGAMKNLAALLTSAWLLGGCASPLPMPPPDTLFDDSAFEAPAVPVDRAAALSVSPAMREYLAARFKARVLHRDRRHALIDALYRGELRVAYDAGITRTAAQTFDARAGNCLSLVMMTAAFAKELGLAVRYQSVLGDDAWDRADDLYIAIGHVNLVLEERRETEGGGFDATGGSAMTIDFVPPPRQARALVTRTIGEPTVVAMYLNNRAVETLVENRLGEAYALAREAIRTDPALLSAYVTLAVVYQRAHRADLADAALRRVIEREPDNLQALSNRVLALRDLGRGAEADALAGRLARLDPNPPFSFFNQGMTALREGRVEAARRLFAREVERAPYHHEFEYWLAVSYARLDDIDRATVHLRRAMQVSTTRHDHDLYAGKLERLKAQRTQ